MRCKEARQRWHRRLDEGNSDVELEQHLETCLSCRDYSARMSGLIEILHEVRRYTERISPPTYVVPTHVTTEAPGPRRLRLWALLRVAAAIAFVVLAGIWFLPRGKEQSARFEPPEPTQRVAAAESNTGGIALNGESRSRFIAVAVNTGDERVRAYRLYRQP